MRNHSTRSPGDYEVSSSDMIWLQFLDSFHDRSGSEEPWILCFEGCFMQKVKMWSDLLCIWEEWRCSTKTCLAHSQKSKEITSTIVLFDLHNVRHQWWWHLIFWHHDASPWNTLSQHHTERNSSPISTVHDINWGSGQSQSRVACCAQLQCPSTSYKMWRGVSDSTGPDLNSNASFMFWRSWRESYLQQV